MVKQISQNTAKSPGNARALFFSNYHFVIL